MAGQCNVVVNAERTHTGASHRAGGGIERVSISDVEIAPRACSRHVVANAYSGRSSIRG